MVGSIEKSGHGQGTNVEVGMSWGGSLFTPSLSFPSFPLFSFLSFSPFSSWLIFYYYKLIGALLSRDYDVRY